MNREFNSISFRIRIFLTFIIQRLRYYKYRIQGYDLHISTQMERNINLDRINPKGIHIGYNTIVTSRVTICSHYLIPYKINVDKKELTKYKGEKTDTYVGNHCVIGTGAIILSGIKIGNNCVVGAGSVVTKDILDNTIVAGNPARIIRTNNTMNNIKL